MIIIKLTVQSFLPVYVALVVRLAYPKFECFAAYRVIEGFQHLVALIPGFQSAFRQETFN